VGRPRRRNSTRPRRGTPEALAEILPDGLRRFRPSTDPNDFRLHLAAVARFVGNDHLALPVMKAAGLSAADWYRRAFGITTDDELARARQRKRPQRP
jgi:hypothetical protein